MLSLSADPREVLQSLQKTLLYLRLEHAAILLGDSPLNVGDILAELAKVQQQIIQLQGTLSDLQQPVTLSPEETELTLHDIKVVAFNWSKRISMAIRDLKKGYSLREFAKHMISKEKQLRFVLRYDPLFYSLDALGRFTYDLDSLRILRDACWRVYERL